MRSSIYVAAFLITADSAEASTDIAHQLGSMLASEQFCDLKYNQDALSAFIEKNVDEGDMSFAPMLSFMTDGHSVGLKELDASGKIAHCTQIRRAAKKNGFTD